MLQIQTSTDWPTVKSEINDLKRSLPLFKHDFDRVLSNIDQHVKLLSNLEVEYRRSKNKNAYLRCSSQIDLINSQLNLLNQWYLIALLSN